LGPYIPTWMKGAASWHPSIIGHRLRASHHAYFWLLIWIDAIDTIIDSLSKHHNLDVFLKHISNHLEKLGHVKLETPIHESIFPDNAKCYTDYEPRMVRESSLKSKVIHGLISADQEANADAKGGTVLHYMQCNEYIMN